MDKDFENRRKSDRDASESISEIEARLSSGDSRMDRIESNMAEALEILKLGKTFFKFAGWFGAIVKWSLGIGVAISAIWVASKTK